MRGEFLPVWSETWREIWSKLAEHPHSPADLFSELFRAHVRAPIPPPPLPPPEELDVDGKMVREEDIRNDAAYRDMQNAYVTARALYEETIADERKAKPGFLKALPSLVAQEADAVRVMERSFRVIDDYGRDSLNNRFYDLVDGFLTKFSLRYDLRRPFTLHPTLTGVFAGMVTELKAVTRADAHLFRLMQDFEEAIRDLRTDASSNRIRACIRCQMNLLEAMGQACPNVTENTLGRICDQLAAQPNPVWPHDRVREALKDLYRFASDYPGIRHGGTQANARRDIDMRDLVAISVLLAGFTPYLSHQIDSNVIYGG